MVNLNVNEQHFVPWINSFTIHQAVYSDLIFKLANL